MHSSTVLACLTIPPSNWFKYAIREDDEGITVVLNIAVFYWLYVKTGIHYFFSHALYLLQNGNYTIFKFVSDIVLNKI